MNKAKKLMKLALGAVPSKLPRGIEEFDEYCRSIFELYDLPDLPNYRLAIASIIMHLGPTVTRSPKLFFAKSIHKADTNEAAFEAIQKLKEEDKRKREEALKESQSECVGEFNKD